MFKLGFKDTKYLFSKSRSIFAEGTYYVNDKLTVKAGVRLSEDDKDVKSDQVASSGGTPGGIGRENPTLNPAILGTLINLTELKKLESFLIDNENITEESILTLITDNIDLNFNKIIQLCTSGKIKESLFYLDKIYENSSSAINITRLFMKHFKIIEKILLKVENGSNLSETINNARPPIFFKDRPLLTNQCRLWSLKKINLIFKRLIEIELKCKSSIYPDKILISQFILSTALMAKNSART